MTIRALGSLGGGLPIGAGPNGNRGYGTARDRAEAGVRTRSSFGDQVELSPLARQLLADTPSPEERELLLSMAKLKELVFGKAGEEPRREEPDEAPARDADPPRASGLAEVFAGVDAREIARAEALKRRAAAADTSKQTEVTNGD